MFKFESDEGKNLALTLICFTILIITSVYFYNLRVKHYVDNGYSRETLIGSDLVVWVKN